MIQKATGQIPEDLRSLDCPDLFVHVWQWFHQLSNTRSSNGFGQNPITYVEIAAWSKLTQNYPDVIEIAAIKALDASYLNKQAEAAERQKK